jgi:hypothetical protein
MSHAANHFHVAQSLLASIDGELCGLLKQVNEEANDDYSLFDAKWIPHLDRIAELATMHFDIFKHYSKHLITMRAFRDMCTNVIMTVSKFGIPKINTPTSPYGSQNDPILKDIFESASTVWKRDKSYDINKYDKAIPFFKKSLQHAVTDRIEFCKKTIEWINWYIQTLQTLISNFDALDKTKIRTMVEKILKPECVIFHIPESDPLSTLKSLVQRARELLYMKEHPDAFDAHVQTMAIEMMRETDEAAKRVAAAERRSNVHEMMADAYASKPTLSQKQFSKPTLTAYASKPTLSQKQFKMQSASVMLPHFHPEFHSLAANGPYIFGNIGRPSYGSFGVAAEAAAAAEAEEAAITLQRAYRNIKSRKKAAITIQRAYRNIKSRKSSNGKGGKRQIKKRNSR